MLFLVSSLSSLGAALSWIMQRAHFRIVMTDSGRGNLAVAGAEKTCVECSLLFSRCVVASLALCCDPLFVLALYEPFEERETTSRKTSRK